MPHNGTERKRTQRAFEEDGERFRSLFEAVSLGVVVSGPAAEVKDCNQAALDLLGLTRDQLVGRTSFDPDWEAKKEDGSLCAGEERPIPRAIATRQRVRGEVIGVYRTGTQDWVWLGVNAEPRLAADGTVVEVVCWFTDITDQRRAEEEVREERFRKVFAHAATGMTLQSLEGVFLEVNRAYCEITGYEERDLIGANYRSITHPEDLERNLSEMQELLAGKVPSLVMNKRYLGKDGRVVWVRNSVSLLRDREGAPLHFIVLVEDITGSKQAEEALRASEERFRKVFAHAATGMTLQDFEGNFLEVNQAFCEITGYAEKDLIGANYRSITHPEDLARNVSEMQELLADEIPSFVLEKRYFRKDGRTVWVRNSISLGDSKPARIITLVEDITERKQAEEALRQLSGQLLKVQDEERRRLARELHDGTAQTIAALGMNLSVVSESPVALDARARRALNESVELADQCIRELRTLSYLLHPPMLDDRGLASALAGYAEGFAERSGVAVKLDLTPDLGRLPQEVELMLFRVVQESLTNIHRHSGSRTATIRLARYPQDIVLQVRDQGNGIGKPGPEGGPGMRIGVGIAGMRERVRQIGGTLQIRSRPGGTDVEVLVPLADPYR